MTTRASCSVRQAQPDDATQVATLLAELGYPDNQVADVRRRLELWANETTSRAIVAERHEQVLGIVAVTAIPYLEHEGRWDGSSRLSCPPRAGDRELAGNLSRPPGMRPASLAASSWS